MEKYCITQQNVLCPSSFYQIIVCDCLNLFSFQAVLAVEVREKESIYGFHNNQKILYLKIYVALQKLIAPARRILEQGFNCPGYGHRSYQTFESNIDFEVTFYCFQTASLLLQ